MSEELPDIFAWFMHGERMQDGFFGAQKIRYVPESRLAAAHRAGAREALDTVLHIVRPLINPLASSIEAIDRQSDFEMFVLRALKEVRARYAEPGEEKKG